MLKEKAYSSSLTQKTFLSTKGWSSRSTSIGGVYFNSVNLFRPFLYKGLKFDLRIYVLITSCDPLTIFLHKDGLVRFATELYQSISGENKSNSFIHLTNYAINKNHVGFRNSEGGKELVEDRSSHKRSIRDFFEELENDFKLNTAAI